MTTQKDRIEAAIRHIQTSADIDPWAMEFAVDALKAQIDKDINVPNTDCISRQAAIDAVDKLSDEPIGYLEAAIDALVDLPSAQPDTDRIYTELSKAYNVKGLPDEAIGIIGDLMLSLDGPSAQLDRDIPKKPTETTDRAWGIPHRQAVCPNCDCYLVDVYFIDGSKRKVTYCESCGQAIDWGIKK